MRGAPGPGRRAGGPGGIIPADAGSTAGAASAWTCPEDHPRGCGEHPFLLIVDIDPEGSSPRMRGALGDVLDELDGGGIIPADAGSTLSARQTRTFQKDHPRGCGEHSDLPWYKLFSTGSSPRMRGAPFIHAFRQIDPWIIPADAGST